MSQATDGQTREELEVSTSLFDVLHNSLILRHIAPYLSIYSLLRLSATSKDFHSLIRTTPGVFRHLDLTRVKRAKFDVNPTNNGGEVWRNVQVDEHLTEDDAIRQQNFLQDVQTLILDGLSVTSDLCHEIINDPSYSVRVLSIRDVRNLNQAKLRGALQYACRPSRPESSPRLKAIYVFGSKEADPEQTSGSISAGWNRKSQQVLPALLKNEGDKSST
ncbi:hypothetical protein E4U41_007241 [Claviceps citrina]|nr:hypothetical protein E4U41_007241 [Claviceps citrina]